MKINKGAQKREYKIFPYYGTKHKAVDLIWDLVPPSVNHLIEPFVGSMVVSLYRPERITKVLVNDYNALIVNFWRAVKKYPEDVLSHARRPVSDLDMWAAELTTKDWAAKQLPRMGADIEYCDVRMAGLWLYGQCNYLANNFGVLTGPWHAVPDEDGVPALTKVPNLAGGKGIRAMVPNLAGDKGIRAQVPELCRDKGISANAPCSTGHDEDPWAPVMRKIQKNIESFRILCGDWSRVVTKGVINDAERAVRKTVVFLDPPYDDRLSSGGGQDYVGSSCVGKVSKDVRDWCAETTKNGSNLVIILCGRKTEHDELLGINGWSKHAWSTNGGYNPKDKDSEALWCYNTNDIDV